ncbi:hypothetical protein [Peribacillus muralis]|uniref:hypothetical protein n=1 Tax=Peribacillus muralis TaxID=264697 RepID=UPI00070D5B1E|nr:hypothetical protein [Peribacillus muralis]
MKIQLKYTVLLVLTTIFVILYFSQNEQAEETITYFPIDSSLHFEHASTQLTAKENGGDSYSVTWRVNSALDRPAYLRQDVSLLYTNGKLTGALKNWRQNKQELSQKAKAKERESGRYDAVTFHYAEVHPSETIFTSAQQLSKDKIYAVTTPSFQYFHRPLSEEQIEWKKTLDSLTAQTVQDGLEKVSQAYHINLNHYNIISLTDLPAKKNQWLSAFPSFKREEIVGKLWEGLYKNYVLGIKKEDGSTVNAQGSTIPLLLMAQNQRELLVLFTLKDGTPIMLSQKL